jgi:uncharacterized membrane protein YdjX (TVP38/TMEM64 family)
MRIDWAERLGVFAVIVLVLLLLGYFFAPIPMLAVMLVTGRP